MTLCCFEYKNLEVCAYYLARSRLARVDELLGTNKQ